MSCSRVDLDSFVDRSRIDAFHEPETHAKHWVARALSLLARNGHRSYTQSHVFEASFQPGLGGGERQILHIDGERFLRSISRRHLVFVSLFRTFANTDSLALRPGIVNDLLASTVILR